MVRATLGTPSIVSSADKPPPADEELRASNAIAACFVREQTIDLQETRRPGPRREPDHRHRGRRRAPNLAERMLARSLLFPTFNLGTTVSLHQGPLLTGTGVVRPVDRDSLYFGAGADVRGAGLVGVPGVQIVANLSDAVFALRVAQQKVTSSQFDAAATRNSVLLNVATSYLALVGAESRCWPIGNPKSSMPRWRR